MKRLASKVAVVTGGATGIGRTIAEKLLGEDAAVIVSDINSATGEAMGAATGARFYRHDVTSEADWQGLVEQIGRDFGRLDVLVNNAGIVGSLSNPENILLEDWMSVQQVNVQGVLLGCRAVIPLMAEGGGGAIVNICSIASEKAAPDSVAYGASKAALQHLTTSVAVQCARKRYKIRCNSVHPGPVLTDLVRAGAKGFAKARGISEAEALEQMKLRVPDGDFIEPDDIANAVLFLASDESRRITGASLFVDGGQICT